MNNNNEKRKNKKTSNGRRRANRPKSNIDNMRMGNLPVHTFTRCAQTSLRIGANGIIGDIGLVPYKNFSIWYTPQSVFIYGDAANYIIVSIPGYTDLAGLFDEVMIESVDMGIYATNLESSTNVGSVIMILSTDYNDKIAPTSNTDLLQYTDCKFIPLAHKFSYTEKQNPKMLSYTLDSAGISQPSTPIKGFVRSNLDVEHYCRKGSLLQTPTLTQVYTAVFRITYKCRVVK